MLDPTKQVLLVDLIHTYFPLSVKQMERYQRLVSREENRKVQDVELTWAEKLMEKGREEGLEKGHEAGLLDGKRQTLLSLLTAKFGPLSDATTNRVQAIDSVGELEDRLRQILTATSLAEMGL